MSCSPERVSSYRRHFHGSSSSLVKVRVSSPSPVRTSARSASYSTAAAKAMPAAGKMSRTASSSSNRRLPIVAVSSGAFGRFVNGACPPTADLDAAAAENREFLSTRSGERREMIVLNDRLAAYIEKVRSLETQNTLLESEIGSLRNRFVKPTGMRRLYEDQLKELLRIANQARVQRDLAVAAKEAMAGQLEEIRRRYEEALEQRKQAEMDLVALRPDVDRATSTRIAMEKQLEQLEAEIEFLKRIQKEEIEELMQQIYATVATAQSSFALPDLSSALKQIQTQYDDIAAKNLQEMDSWYGSKFEDMGNKSSKNIDKLRSAREEMNNMKKEIQNKEQDLEDLQAKNDGSEAQLRETQERHKAELENLKARIEALQTELKTTKQKTAKLLQEYQELLNVKMALEVEIITYRKLIEGEDSRLTVMQLSLGSSGSMGASSVGKSTVTLGGGGSVVAKNGDGSNGGGSVAATNGGGSVKAKNGDGSNGGGFVAAKNGDGSNRDGSNRDGSVKAKNGGPGTGSAESGSNANNGDGQEGNGVGANGSGQNGQNGQNGANAVTEASASAAGKGLGEEGDAKVDGGADGPGRSGQRSANGGTTPDESDTADIDIGPDRNWKGIGISLLVIVLVLSLIGLSIVLLSKDDGSKSVGSHLTLDDLFQRRFQVHDPEARWISDEEFIFRSWDGDVVKANTQSNDTDVLLKNTTFPTFKATKFAVSPDLNFVLLGYDVRQVYRHSFLASYLIYNLHTREVKELNPPEVSDSVLQFASWGVQGQQLMYIFENNIYYQTDASSSSWRLTSSGQEGVVYNGLSDWLYEEEVLHTQVAHWWSPDGSRLAYLSVNDSLVPSMQLARFTGALYPRGHSYPYPKMGQVNPVVRLYVVSLDGSSLTTELPPPDSFEKSEYYVTMVTWVTNQRAAVRWVNRAQNMSILTVCDITRGDCVKKHVMTSEKWLDRQNEEPVFSKDGSTFFITMPLKHGGSGAFRHITMISHQSKGQEVNLRHLTSGSWEVCEILAYDHNSNRVYFLSTEDGATQRQLYRVSTVDPFHRQCVSCFLFRPQCSYYSALFSPDYQHVLLTCRGPGIPQTTLHRLTDMTESVMVEKNEMLQEALVYRTLPKRDRRTIHINDFALRLEISVPAHLDEAKQHPLLLMLDSAPGGQTVSDRFSLDWDSVLVSSDHVIVARLDGRGSGFQGQRILHELYQRLGSVDVQDHIAALEYLLKLPYVDGKKAGVYGKAYGGFLSTLLLLSNGSMFKCGVAVAPVTNWRLYDSAFTERYFGFPGKQDSRYQISSLLSNVSDATVQRKLLIIHGTADATVHFQHSAELVKLLSTSNANYTLQIFPDEDHDMASVQSRYYMQSSTLNFFRSCFQEENPVPTTSKEDD